MNLSRYNEPSPDKEVKKNLLKNAIPKMTGTVDKTFLTKLHDCNLNINIRATIESRLH